MDQYMKIFCEAYGGSVFEPVDEGVVSKIKDAVKTVINKMIEWVHAFINVLRRIKKYIMDKAKAIVAKFKGEKVYTITRLDTASYAVKNAKDAAKALAHGDTSKVNDAVEKLNDAKETKEDVKIISGDQLLKHNADTTKLSQDTSSLLEDVKNAVNSTDDPKSSEKLCKACVGLLKAFGADEKTLADFKDFETFDKKFSNNEPFEL